MRHRYHEQRRHGHRDPRDQAHEEGRLHGHGNRQRDLAQRPGLREQHEQRHDQGVAVS